MNNAEDDIEIKIERPSRAERWKRSVTARIRRQVSKFAKTTHIKKEEDESVARLRAKKLLGKQKKQNIVDKAK